MIFDFEEKILGEIQIIYEYVPPQYESHHMLCDLELAKTYLDFMQIILKCAKMFADKELLVWATSGELISID